MTGSPIQVILSMLYNFVVSRQSIYIIALLVVLLLVKEFFRTSNHGRSRAWMQSLDIVIVPLLIIFSLIIVIRFLSL